MIKIQGKTKFQDKTIFDGGPTAASTAEAYIAAVEAADGESLESGVATAYTNFISGLWADGTWSSLKAACILAGARTLNGALVPLVGTAPTNNNFVSADYNRETGLVGNRSTKYLNSNRNDSADPQNSKHIAVNVTVGSTYYGNMAIMGALNSSNYYGSQLTSRASGTGYIGCNSPGGVNVGSQYVSQTGLIGTTRANSSQISYRLAGSTSTASSSSIASDTIPIYVFKRNLSVAPYPVDSRLSFYSIGESLDLALLDSRVSTLMSDLAAAI